MLAIVLLVLATTAPKLLRIPNRAWFKLGMVLHAIVSPLVLGTMFFLIIAPWALVMRLAGRDALARRYEPNRPSYWIERTPPGPKPESLKNQF